MKCSIPTCVARSIASDAVMSKPDGIACAGRAQMMLPHLAVWIADLHAQSCEFTGTA